MRNHCDHSSGYAGEAGETTGSRRASQGTSDDALPGSLDPEITQMRPRGPRQTSTWRREASGTRLISRFAAMELGQPRPMVSAATMKAITTSEIAQPSSTCLRVDIGA